MMISIADVLDARSLAQARQCLETAEFVDGRTSAGWSAQLVKRNQQAGDSPRLDALRLRIAERLAAHPVFALALRPKRILGPLFSRYEPGHAYGTHVDDAIMDGMRTDISFTLFLSSADSYDGGELVIDTPAGEDAVKLEAGSLIAYQASALHRVNEVTRGARLAAVGWVRSQIRDAGRRELLFDLESARRRIFDRDGKTPEFDLLAKCAANLTRMWCDD